MTGNVLEPHSDCMDHMTDDEHYEEYIRLALLDAEVNSFELSDKMAQLISENLDISDVDARIVELGWFRQDDDETWEEFLEGQRRANMAPHGLTPEMWEEGLEAQRQAKMALHIISPNDLNEPHSSTTTHRTRVYLDRKCKKTG